MKLKSQSGSILLSTLSFIILLAIAAGSILELTMNSYKLTIRNEVRAQARAVAESEMESIFFQWVSQIMSAVPASSTPTYFETLGIADRADVPSSSPDRAPFLKQHRDEGWRVHRSVYYNATYDYFEGMIPVIKQLGKATFVTVRIEVLPNANSFFRNEAAVRVGRRFSTTNTSIFQYGVFYQGDLEMAPGNDITIDGDVVANGSIYMASTSPGHLTLNKNVRYLGGGYFNADSSGVTLRKPNTPIGGSLIAPIFGTSQADQVAAMDAPANLLGGIDASEISSRRPDLFPTENDVYRAAIVPPPDATDEYPSADTLQGDDPVINVTRMYTRAGLRVTVNNVDGSVSFVSKATDGTEATVTSTYAGNITDQSLPVGDPNRDLGPIVVGPSGSDFYDLREGKTVKVTTINMHALMVAINQTYPTGDNDFNGALYINLKGSDATTPRGVELINGADVTGRKGLGTTVTTNGGLYVKGNYNTSSAVNPDDSSTNPAMLMADQITVLSDTWNDANAVASSPLSDRVVPPGHDITINAGILTGNTSATATQASGGAQNLIRYLENWNGVNVTVFGSLGRLFESKTFHSWFQQPGLVYGKPANRFFRFDAALLKHPPAGSPTTTSFQRGSFFVWSR